jgi:hypothetical protein
MLLVVGGFWAVSCTKPTAFGSELLDDELADYVFTDTFSLRITLLREDSVTTSDRTSTAPYFLCGELNDPVFGNSRSELYTLVRLGNLNPGFNPSRQRIDSMVLFLRLSKAGVYGDTLVPQTLRVFRLDEALQNDKAYYSNSTIPASEEIGGIEGYMPRPNAADSLFTPTTRASFVRIPLSVSFGNSLLASDSVSLNADSAFYKTIRGIKITAQHNGLPGAMLAFNLNDDSYSRIRMYYTEDDTLSKTYDFFFEGANKFTHFTHENQGTLPGQLLGQPAEELMFLQGMAGLKLKVELPHIDQLDRVAINDADLVLTTADAPGDLPILQQNPADQLVLTESSGDTLFFFTSDVVYSVGSSGGGNFLLFGGAPESTTINGVMVKQYRLSLSQRLQDMVDVGADEIKKKTIYVNLYPQSRSAMRSILYGPKSLVFPAKLALKYTRL